MTVRSATVEDRDSWSTMRTLLWPETNDSHLSEIDDYFSGKSIDVVEVFVFEMNSEIVGFLELNIRNFAEGSRRSRVPYVDAWYVKPEYQGRGYGRKLMEQAEAWAIAKDYAELASDTGVENTHSIELHKRLGFSETERIVCFLKSLRNA